MAPPHIWGAFGALGLEFEFDTRSEPHRLLFDEAKLTGSAGFRDLWSVGFPLDKLSGRRRIAPFGWINMDRDIVVWQKMKRGRATCSWA
jgi:hypothetical protein